MRTLNIGLRTLNTERLCFGLDVRRSMFNVQCSTFLIFSICLFVSLVNEVSAADSPIPPLASAQPANLPAVRAFNESDALELLTTTLQKDYVMDRGDLEL